jgi:hypothetical protein
MKTPQELFDAYLDGDMSPVDLRSLEAWLAEDDAHAAEFMEWISLQSLTYDALKGALLEQVMHDAESYRLRAVVPDAEEESRLSRFSLWWPALAASVVATAFLLNGQWTSDVPERSMVVAEKSNPANGGGDAIDDTDELSGQASSEPSLVATLTRLEDCVWRHEDSAMSYGQQLYEGARIELQQGVARVTFESGAVATLEGPCDFVVDNVLHGTIHRGRVSVTAPKRAYGFRIRSPNSEVIDLGTEFGVAVDERGGSEVHVFSGEVLSRRLDAQGLSPGKLFRLTANNGLKFATPDQRPRKIASDTSLFPDQAGVRSKPKAELLPTEDRLALWLAADVSAKADDNRRVFAWSDILYGDNLSAEDAFQPDAASQPKMSRRGINGKPAVRFNGSSSYLVTTPLETTDDQTIFIVCQFSQRALRPERKRGGQLLNYNGPPHRLVSSTYEPGVLQIGEPIVEGFAPTRLGGKLFAGRIDKRDVSDAEMYSSPLGSIKPVVLAYRYDLTNNIATLRINGELIEEKAALRPAGITSRKVIGRHGFMKFFFAGDIGELLIYNGALNPAEMKQVSEYLSKKYEIPLAAAQDAI